jgi:hypothetical protein
MSCLFVFNDHPSRDARWTVQGGMLGMLYRDPRRRRKCRKGPQNVSIDVDALPNEHSYTE